MSAWAEDDIPTNKMLLKGAASLSNAELLSIIIGSGIEGENSLDIAMRLLASCDNNLCELWKRDVQSLTGIRGIGMKRAVQIVAVCHMARRRGDSEALQMEKIRSSQDVFRLLKGSISDIPYEEFWVVNSSTPSPMRAGCRFKAPENRDFYFFLLRLSFVEDFCGNCTAIISTPNYL
jgi:DNA repair protein RadC